MGAPLLEPQFVTVRKQYNKGDPEEETELMRVEEFFVPPARISLELGVTINTGNFESVRLSVGVQVPCYREEIPGAYEYWLGYVKKRIVEEQSEIKEWAVNRGAKNSSNLF